MNNSEKGSPMTLEVQLLKAKAMAYDAIRLRESAMRRLAQLNRQIAELEEMMKQKAAGPLAVEAGGKED